MKKIILLLTILSLGIISVSAESTKVSNDDRLCKVFTDKVSSYKKDMRDDSYAQKTLESYQKRAKDFCSK